ncbi:Phosphoenolpyruvate synthase regulatory protein [Meiothermus luteus]|jgi:regulator of PEP synthase PpsR (kinase-PPPase family)|uniref:Putative phosphoenolpyruvate synthase regulatory protein n=1 Tax=Meiothermus luteus TaxID=2026184 RepID=A0A399F0E5_9DEIN|nr:pyruvate, water dikinase regulatory protein [Meiothermus luteus]RIH88252.1 Phosphoenolpyruvate synthase regulatory protein [Meiothermus luteus]
MQRTVFIVSDHTGLTAESVARSLLAQFEGISFRYVTRPFTDSEEEVYDLLYEINATFEQEGVRPIVFSTLANPVLNDQLKTAPALHFDLFRTYLGELERELGRPPMGRVGRLHSISDRNYFARIEAVDFALSTDDGLGERYYQMADVILTGVSRAGKTPTCLFLGMQYGIRASNYPLVEADFERETLPEPIRPYHQKVFGLTIQPFRLHQIRTQRKPGSRYASLEQCEYEVRRAEQLFRRLSIRYFDTTSASVEEIAANIVQTAGLRRRID